MFGAATRRPSPGARRSGCNLVNLFTGLQPRHEGGHDPGTSGGAGGERDGTGRYARRMFVPQPLSGVTRERLLAGGIDPDAVAAMVRAAVAEDLMGGADVTSVATIDADHRSTATFGARASGVVAGLDVAAAVVDTVCGAEASGFEHVAADGVGVGPGAVIARVTAPTRALLTAERTALNLLCHLSGVATITRRWTDALSDTPARVRDTRKTTPGLRFLEKYAVRCGGGVNHRMGLADMALIKDNHVAAAGGITAAIERVRAGAPGLHVQVEVDTLDGLHEALAAGADDVLLDNFDVTDTVAAVAVRDEVAPRAVLEASGGLTLETATAVGRTGIDHIAVGELTHSARALDIGLDLVPES